MNIVLTEHQATALHHNKLRAHELLRAKDEITTELKELIESSAEITSEEKATIREMFVNTYKDSINEKYTRASRARELAELA